MKIKLERNTDLRIYVHLGIPTMHQEGGVTYLSAIPNAQPTEVAVICLNRDKSYDLLLENYSFTAASIVQDILGYIPNVGTGAGIVFTIQGISDRIAVTNIKNNGGCAKIVNTYSREYGTKASVLTGWSDRFNIVIPSNSSERIYTSF